MNKELLVLAKALVALLAIGVFHVATAAESYQGDTRPNFILMIGDDMAVETLDCYKLGSETAHTPNLDQLCDQGVRFDNFWSQPVCSPTRATLLTGQYGFLNGVGAPANGISDIDWRIPEQEDRSAGGQVAQGGMGGGQGGMGGAQGGMGDQSEDSEPRINPALKPDAYTFIAALQEGGYQTAAVGKWHLANDQNGGLEHPQKVGFDHYSGSMRGGGVSTYDGWSKVVDGSQPFGKTGYATTDTVDDGIAWLDQLESTKPFFLWVAFNAPHTPFHMPPTDLLSEQTASIDPAEATPHQMYTAMIEAMDTEIGRLLSSLDQKTRDNTYVVFMGDNGTPGQAQVFAPFTRGKVKGSVYQGGVNVPFMFSGPGIAKSQTTLALANSVDMFNTVLELSGVQASQQTAIHSVSLAPILTGSTDTEVREFAYADVFGGVGGGSRDSRAIRNSQYKLIQNRQDGSEELYNLAVDPYENTNLLASELSEADQSGYDWLAKKMKELTGE